MSAYVWLIDHREPIENTIDAHLMVYSGIQWYPMPSGSQWHPMVANGSQLRSNLMPKRPFAMLEEKEEEAEVQNNRGHALGYVLMVHLPGLL
jgi:hypothetical protein